ncbi:MAG: hypothetical protein ACYC0X_23445 [Pirellulaceae bacterium]
MADGTDPDTEVEYRQIKEAARRKFLEMLTGDGFDVESEPYHPGGTEGQQEDTEVVAEGRPEP